MHAAIGNKLTPTSVQAQPSVDFVQSFDEPSIPVAVVPPQTVEKAEKPIQYHTLVMIDPDAPSRRNPKHGEWFKLMMMMM